MRLLFVHAHPDDEASQTAGTQRLLADAGHRVVVVYATNGDHGVAPEDLAPGETVVDRRRAEADRTQAAAAASTTTPASNATTSAVAFITRTSGGRVVAAAVEVVDITGMIRIMVEQVQDTHNMLPFEKGASRRHTAETGLY